MSFISIPVIIVRNLTASAKNCSNESVTGYPVKSLSP